MKVKAISTFLSPGKRPLQEDFILSEGEKGIFVVADGFGGPGAGDMAAKTSCEAVRGFLLREARDPDATLPFILRSYYSLAGNVLFNALIHANRQVKLANRNKNVHEKGGASAIAGFVDGDLLAIANVGACSAWLLRQNEQNGQNKINPSMTELVLPRSFGRLCDPFNKEVAQDFQAPLTALGISDDLEPEIFEYRLQEGDWLLFCTDGVPLLALEELRGFSQEKIPLDQLVSRVNKQLNQLSYCDNAAISLVIF